MCAQSAILVRYRTIDGQIDRKTDEQTNGQTNGQMDRTKTQKNSKISIHIYFNVTSKLNLYNDIYFHVSLYI